MQPADFEAAFEMDAQRYKEHNAGREQLLSRLEAYGPLGDDVLSEVEERLLRAADRSVEPVRFQENKVNTSDFHFLCQSIVNHNKEALLALLYTDHMFSLRAGYPLHRISFHVVALELFSWVNSKPKFSVL